MSSITDPRAERGQILVIFAFSLLVIFGIAALVFDGGLMLLEKRTQQNAADAAALAGARFLPDDIAEAEAAAIAIATENGFTDGVNNQSVNVNIPPSSGPNAGQDGYIEVLIDNQTGSFFSGIWGIFAHDVGSRAVAANDTTSSGPFALLSLDPSGCAALIIEGQGELISNGNIQVNSTCSPNAMRLAGQGEIVTAPNVACNVVGDFSQGGPSSYTCDMNAANTGASVVPIPDPLAGLNEPPHTDGLGGYLYPLSAPVQLGGTTKPIPPGCPGGSAPASDAAPAVCEFAGSYKNTTWRIYPGYYPGGIRIQGGDFYFEPGIYYVTGPTGFNFEGNEASAISVDAGGTTVGGGVLLYSGDHPTASDGTISIRGGNTAGVTKVNFLPLDNGSEWDNIVIFQDREICNDVVINGSKSKMELRGIIYVPGNSSCPADHPVLIAEGDGGTVVTDQVIAFRFQMKGNIGSLTVAYDDNYLPSNRVAGLVE